MKTLNHRASAKGFTLIEAMVALVIVGTALPALLFQVLTITDHTAYLRDKALAQWVAQNKMTELRLLKRLKGESPTNNEDGEVEMAQTQWKWKVSSEKTDFIDSFNRVTVTVYRGGNSATEETLVALEGIMSE